jgi:hypothetical protein
MYQSTKFGSYRFFHFPGFDKPGDTPDKEKFFESLVSYFYPGELSGLTELELIPSGKRKKKETPGLPKTISNALKAGQRKQRPNDEGNWLTEQLESLFSDPVYKTTSDGNGTRYWLWVKSKECSIAGRAHKGNHIKYVFDLELKTYTQVCNDIECYNQSGETKEIPQSFWPDIQKFLKEKSEFSLKKLHMLTITSE